MRCTVGMSLNPDTVQLSALAEFYRTWGHCAELHGGCLWSDGGALSLMSVPTTLVPQCTDAGVRSLLVHTGKIAAVYRVPGPDAAIVPAYYLRDKAYDAAQLQRQFRQQVRLASSRMDVRSADWSEWVRGAVRCDRETLSRYRQGARHPLLSAVQRETIAEAARATPGLSLHACFLRREIVAYLIHLTLGHTCEGLFVHRCETIDPDRRFASHLLYHGFAREMIRRPEINAICVGRQSVPANHSLEAFKRHAGFKPEACHLRVRLHPRLAPLLENRLAAQTFAALRHRLAASFPVLSNLEVLEKAAAVPAINPDFC